MQKLKVIYAVCVAHGFEEQDCSSEDVGGQFWEGLWPCLSPFDVIRVRAAAEEFNDAKKYGPHAEDGGPREDEEVFQRLTLTEPSRRMVLKERDPWLTPTESCESDETEVEDVPSRRTEVREPMHGCQPGVTTNVERHVHPRYKQMEDIRPFDWIVSVKISDEQSDQTRLSILGWNAGQKRGNVARRVMGSFHVVLLRDAESHCHEIAASAEQQFHIQGADQLLLCCMSLTACKNPGRNSGHIKARLFGFDVFVSQVKVQEAA